MSRHSIRQAGVTRPTHQATLGQWGGPFDWWRAVSDYWALAASFGPQAPPFSFTYGHPDGRVETHTVEVL